MKPDKLHSATSSSTSRQKTCDDHTKLPLRINHNNSFSSSIEVASKNNKIEDQVGVEVGGDSYENDSVSVKEINSSNELYFKSESTLSSKTVDNCPLISDVQSENLSKAVKKLNLKKNGSTIVIQKKSNDLQQSTSNSMQIVGKKQNTKSNNNSSKTCQNNTSTTADFNRKVRHSWYGTNDTEGIPNEINLKSASPNNGNLHNAPTTALEMAGGNDKVPEITRTKQKDEQNVASRRWRIEEFFKNLVGKKSNLLMSQKKGNSSEAMEQQSLVKIRTKSDLTNASLASLDADDVNYKSTTSLNSVSLSIVNQKIWSVLPLLNKKNESCNNIQTLTDNENVLKDLNELKFRKKSGNDQLVSSIMKKQSKSIQNLLEPIKPLNRLRNSKSCYIENSCSRCSSLLSLSALGSNNSLNYFNGTCVKKPKEYASLHSASYDFGKFNHFNDDSNDLLLEQDVNEIEVINESKIECSSNDVFKLKRICKLCLSDVNEDQMTKIKSCDCFFCIECMKAYVEFEISEGAYELSCPDALCKNQGILSFDEIQALTSSSLVAKHHRYRLNREVEMDKNRVWCPNRNCETICSIEPLNRSRSLQPSSSNLSFLAPRAVVCLTCSMEFCSNCKKKWHPSLTCEENGKKLGGTHDSIMLFDNDLIKCCPMCSIPIEKDEGCAQMMCKRCKHVFCWYCLSSLDDDFLLRHYDKGPCKNKLGHSRASVVWHRAQVIGIFAGFGILLLVASPLLLLAAPCIVCCKCKIEESSSTSKVLDSVQLEEL